MTEPTEQPVNPSCTYTFHPKDEGWGYKDELKLELEFDIGEVEKLLELRQLSTEIKKLLPWAEASGLSRDFVASGSLGVPWAYTLQNRDSALLVIKESLDRMATYEETFFNNPDMETSVANSGFTLEIMDQIRLFKEGMMEFLPEEEIHKDLETQN